MRNPQIVDGDKVNVLAGAFSICTGQCGLHWLEWLWAPVCSFSLEPCHIDVVYDCFVR